MKNSYILAGSCIFVLLSYLFSTIFGYSFYSIVTTIAAALTVVGILFSGALPDGERMRANYATDAKATRTGLRAAWKFLIAAFPFYLTILVVELLS